MTDAEKRHSRLSSEFYPTYGFVTRVDDNHGWSDPTTGRKRVIDPAWLTPWRQYDQLWSAASALNNYANHSRTGHDWEQFAAGTPVDTMRAQLMEAGGLLGRDQTGPGPIPMTDHPDEVAVDRFMDRAHNAYVAWLPNPIPATRGPSDGNQLTGPQVELLRTRPKLGRGWWFANSFTGGVSVHHTGPSGAPTFIYHVQDTH